jgi:glycine/D-amino acid oxidase-like deaminating enzyme
MFETVEEVGRVCETEAIAADFHRGGNLVFATNAAQRANIQADIEYEHSWGFGEEDFRWLSRHEARAHIPIEGALGAWYTPHCASVHPAKLVRGLAKVVEGLGVPIYEHTAVLNRVPHGVRTAAGLVRAEIVVRATEGYTVDLPGLRRALIPVYSLMIATEPLSDDLWGQLGWCGRECWNDGRNLIIYVSRTADGRIAMGGRGAPYHLGSRIDDSYESEPEVFDNLHHELTTLLPPVQGAAVTHRWGGPIGIARDWCGSVGFEPRSGTAWACGYVGDGVSTANLAGRTLADLIGGRESDITQLPWVGHRSRQWEPEPLRWFGVT